MVIIRGPSIFKMVWGVVKHVFPPSAVEKMTFSGPNDHEKVLAKFMDLDVLPPCISPEHGRGYAAMGMPQRLEGGPPPANMDYTEPVLGGAKLEVESMTAEDSDSDAEAPRVSVTGSTLGSGFFQLDAQGEVSASGFFGADDSEDQLVDPLA